MSNYVGIKTYIDKDLYNNDIFRGGLSLLDDDKEFVEELKKLSLENPDKLVTSYVYIECNGDNAYYCKNGKSLSKDEVVSIKLKELFKSKVDIDSENITLHMQEELESLTGSISEHSFDVSIKIRDVKKKVDDEICNSSDWVDLFVGHASSMLNLKVDENIRLYEIEKETTYER